MAFTEKSRESIDRIDLMLREAGDFRDIPLTLEGYKPWYALVLGALATVAGEDEIVFARAQYDAERDSAQLLVFTSSLLTVVDIAGASVDNADVNTRTVSRRTVRSLGLQIGERHDDDGFGRRLQQWPGALRFTLEYSTLATPLEFAALSYDPYHLGETAPAMRLLEGLRQDLAASTQV